MSRTVNQRRALVMAELFGDFPGPVVIGFPSGHTSGAHDDAAVRPWRAA